MVDNAKEHAQLLSALGDIKKHLEAHVADVHRSRAHFQEWLDLGRKLWLEHQRTKFKSDGSHFRADVALNEYFLLGFKLDEIM
jgi:hypothetical protein